MITEETSFTIHSQSTIGSGSDNGTCNLYYKIDHIFSNFYNKLKPSSKLKLTLKKIFIYTDYNAQFYSPYLEIRANISGADGNFETTVDRYGNIIGLISTNAAPYDAAAQTAAPATVYSAYAPDLLTSKQYGNQMAVNNDDLIGCPIFLNNMINGGIPTVMQILIYGYGTRYDRGEITFVAGPPEVRTPITINQITDFPMDYAKVTFAGQTPTGQGVGLTASYYLEYPYTLVFSVEHTYENPYK